MDSPSAPYSWRGVRSSLSRLIVTSFLVSTSPSLFAQTNDNATTARGRGARRIGRRVDRRIGRARQSGGRAGTRRNHGCQRQFRFRLFCPELSRAFRLGTRFTWAQERR